MSANQTAARRPAPITQRDGSKLANSNCRMASIATGLDYDTKGAKKSTGGKMRTYTSDQSGGTDSGDAKEAWTKGYGEGLIVRDGKVWNDVLVDLRAGRMVHLDVWHATVGGPCLSGTGGYGHTMAVLPDCLNNAWLVADPWCNPPKWSRVAESKLKAGAEKWGNQVYGTAGPGTGGGEPPPELLRQIVLELMSRWLPGREGPADPPDFETGGAQRVMYTVSAAYPPVTPTPPNPTPPAGDVVQSFYVPVSPHYCTVRTGAVLYYMSDLSAHAKNITVSPGRNMPYLGKQTGPEAYIVQYVDSKGQNQNSSYWVKTGDVTNTPGVPVPECPDCPEPVPCPDCPDPAPLISAAVNARDDVWDEALRAGDAWPTHETTKETAP